MKQLLYIFTALITSLNSVFADSVPDELMLGKPSGAILTGDDTSPIVILTLIQSILLKVVLPVIVVGASLYIAYELFTAEGDESKMKKAWKSVAYTAIALIAIALSYALVSLVSTLNF